MAQNTYKSLMVAPYIHYPPIHAMLGPRAVALARGKTSGRGGPAHKITLPQGRPWARLGGISASGKGEYSPTPIPRTLPKQIFSRLGASRPEVSNGYAVGMCMGKDRGKVL